MGSNSIRISADLFEQAARQGAVLSRSAAQQLEHWARLGAALEASGLSVPQLVALLQGQIRQSSADGQANVGRDAASVSATEPEARLSNGA